MQCLLELENTNSYNCNPTPHYRSIIIISAPNISKIAGEYVLSIGHQQKSENTLENNFSSYRLCLAVPVTVNSTRYC